MSGAQAGSVPGPVALVGSGEFLPVMEAVDAALLAGYLADTLRGTAVFSAVLAAWHAGAALAGCSAGACALTALAGNTHTGATRPGLAVVPELAVLPHFDRIEEWHPGIVDRSLAELERRPPPGGTTRSLLENS